MASARPAGIEIGEVRAIELEGHPFFVGTLFQPERKALEGTLPPLVRDFVGTMVGHVDLHQSAWREGRLSAD